MDAGAAAAASAASAAAAITASAPDAATATAAATAATAATAEAAAAGMLGREQEQQAQAQAQEEAGARAGDDLVVLGDAAAVDVEENVEERASEESAMVLFGAVLTPLLPWLLDLSMRQHAGRDRALGLAIQTNRVPGAVASAATVPEGVRFEEGWGAQPWEQGLGGGGGGGGGVAGVGAGAGGCGGAQPSSTQWASAVRALLSMSSLCTLHGLTAALLQCRTAIFDELARQRVLASSDCFLPVFILVLARAVRDGLKQPVALCAVLGACCSRAQMQSELGYYVTTLEAALSFMEQDMLTRAR
jgi:hypothetical protein